MALWTATDLPLSVRLHRQALERDAAEWRYVVDGKPIRFTDAEVPRFAFLWWRIHESGRYDAAGQRCILAPAPEVPQD